MGKIYYAIISLMATFGLTDASEGQGAIKQIIDFSKENPGGIYPMAAIFAAYRQASVCYADSYVESLPVEQKQAQAALAEKSLMPVKEGVGLFFILDDKGQLLESINISKWHGDIRAVKPEASTDFYCIPTSEAVLSIQTKHNHKEVSIIM